MKLSDILERAHESGDFGGGLTGLPEMAKALELMLDEKQATIDRLTEQRHLQQVFCAEYEANQFELTALAKEVLRISDRKHDAWDKLKALIAEIEANK